MAKQGMAQTGHGPNRAWAKQGMGQTGHGPNRALVIGNWELVSNDNRQQTTDNRQQSTKNRYF